MAVEIAVKEYWSLAKVAEGLQKELDIKISPVRLRQDIRMRRLHAARRPTGRGKPYLCTPEDVDAYKKRWLLPQPVGMTPDCE